MGQKHFSKFSIHLSVKKIWLGKTIWEDLSFPVLLLFQGFIIPEDRRSRKGYTSSVKHSFFLTVHNCFLTATPVSLPVPIALYPLNGKYTTWDVSGRSNPNGIARGVHLATGPEGHPNDSYQFSGKSDSFIEFPNMGALRARESITLLAWVYIESGNGPIFNYNPLGWGVSLWVNSKRHLAAKFVEQDDQCETCIDSAHPLKTKAWNYVGMSYDQTGGIARLWVNKRVSSQRGIGTNIKLSTSNNARMGARAVNDGNYFNGRISRMQVYDKALSQREIEAVAGPIEGKTTRFS